MLSVLQIVTLLQGVFLIAVLILKRKEFKQPTLGLLVGAIFSVLLFILGDDENNLLSNNVDWFFLDISLFITFLFVFVKYSVSHDTSFRRHDLIYFIPNVCYLFIEISEVLQPFLSEMLAFEILELVVELSFLGYLVTSVYLLYSSKEQRWMFYFMVPMVLLIGGSIIHEIAGWFTIEIKLFDDVLFNSITLLLVAFLFYFIAMQLVLSPKAILIHKKIKKYKSSGLNKSLISSYQKKIIAFMEVDKGYTDSSLSLTTLSQRLDIPKQYISEILNVYLQTNFQDFVNAYRIDAFAECLKKEQYEHFTLYGIAREVGFNSKSTFYSIFKKSKGLTPTEYKKSLLLVS